MGFYCITKKVFWLSDKSILGKIKFMKECAKKFAHTVIQFSLASNCEYLLASGLNFVIELADL